MLYNILIMSSDERYRVEAGSYPDGDPDILDLPVTTELGVGTDGAEYVVFGVRSLQACYTPKELERLGAASCGYAPDVDWRERGAELVRFKLSLGEGSAGDRRPYSEVLGSHK